MLALLPQDAVGGNVELTGGVADNLYVKRQVEEAIAAYDKAAAAAKQAGNMSREFELRYKAGWSSSNRSISPSRRRGSSGSRWTQEPSSGG